MATDWGAGGRRGAFKAKLQQKIKAPTPVIDIIVLPGAVPSAARFPLVWEEVATNDTSTHTHTRTHDDVNGRFLKIPVRSLLAPAA